MLAVKMTLGIYPPTDVYPTQENLYQNPRWLPPKDNSEEGEPLPSTHVHTPPCA